MLSHLHANTTGLPLCDVRLAPASSFFVPKGESLDGASLLKFQPKAAHRVRRRAASSQTPTRSYTFKGFPGVALYTQEETIKSGSSQEVYLTNFRHGSEVTLRLLSAYDKQHLYSPHLRKGWNVAAVSSYDGASDHMVVQWKVRAKVEEV